MAATRSGSRAPRNSANTSAPDGSVRSRQVAHRHRRVEAGTEAARGDLADLFGRRLVREQRRAFAHGGAAFRPQADAAARRALFASWARILSAPGKAAGAGAACAAALLDRPFQRALDRRRRRCRCRGHRGRARPRAAGCRGRRARSAARRCLPAGFWRALRPGRPEPKSQSRPRRCSRSARRSSRCRRPGAARHP